MGEYEMPQKQGNTKMDYLQSLLYEMTLKDNKEADVKDVSPFKDTENSSAAF